MYFIFLIVTLPIFALEGWLDKSPNLSFLFIEIFPGPRMVPATQQVVSN